MRNAAVLTVAAVTLFACVSHAVATEDQCGAAVRKIVRQQLPRYFHATTASERLIIKDDMNSAIYSAMIYENPLAKRLCEIHANDEFKKVYYDLEHPSPRRNKASSPNKAALAPTSKDRECSVSNSVKDIVSKLGPSAYYVDTKEAHEEGVMRMTLQISRLLHSMNLSSKEMSDCVDVGMAAYDNIAKAAQR